MSAYIQGDAETISLEAAVEHFFADKGENYWQLECQLAEAGKTVNPCFQSDGTMFPTSEVQTWEIAQQHTEEPGPTDSFASIPWFDASTTRPVGNKKRKLGSDDNATTLEQAPAAKKIHDSPYSSALSAPAYAAPNDAFPDPTVHLGHAPASPALMFTSVDGPAPSAAAVAPSQSGFPGFDNAFVDLSIGYLPPPIYIPHPQLAPPSLCLSSQAPAAQQPPVSVLSSSLASASRPPPPQIDPVDGQTRIPARTTRSEMGGATYKWDNTEFFGHFRDSQVFSGAVHPHDICGKLLLRLAKRDSNQQLAKKINALWIRLYQTPRSTNSVTKAISLARDYFADQSGVSRDEAWEQQVRERKLNGVNYSRTTRANQRNKYTRDDKGEPSIASAEESAASPSVATEESSTSPLAAAASHEVQSIESGANHGKREFLTAPSIAIGARPMALPQAAEDFANIRSVDISSLLPTNNDVNFREWIWFDDDEPHSSA